MYIPDFIRKAKSGDILATKYGNIFMVARVEIGEKSVCIYDYFDWDKEMGLHMNEWLNGFYGPRYDENENFYIPATDEEKTFFLDKMKEFGYELREMYGDMVPQLTADGYKKFYPCESPKENEDGIWEITAGGRNIPSCSAENNDNIEFVHNAEGGKE